MNNKIAVADFETNDFVSGFMNLVINHKGKLYPHMDENFRMGCYLWMIKSLDKTNFGKGTTEKNFIEYCFNNFETIYFHNLRFDGGVLNDYFLYGKEKKNYQFIGNNFQTLISNDFGNEIMKNTALDIDIFCRSPKKYTEYWDKNPNLTLISTLIDEKGIVYSIILRKLVNKKIKIIRFIDSKKIINNSVFNIGKDLNNEFKKLQKTDKNIFLKGDVSYHKYNSFNWKTNTGINVKNINDFEENMLKYCERDVDIVIAILNRVYTICEDLGIKTSITIGGIIKKDFVNFINTDTEVAKIIESYIEKGLIYFKGKKWNNFKNLYDNQFSYADDKIFRESYIGGATLLGDYIKENNYEVKKNNKNIINADDINSSYPSQTSKLIPFGKSSKTPWPNFKNYKFVKIKITFYTTKKGYPATLPHFLKTNNIENLYIKSIPYIDADKRKHFNMMIYVRWFTETDYKRICRSDFYNGKYIKIIDTRYFKGDEFNMLGMWVKKWYKIKEENKGVNESLYLFSKLCLNNFYGKFGENGIKIGRYYDDEKEEFVLALNNLFRFKTNHIAIASAITSYARDDLFNIIYKLCDNKKYEFLYADTDSIYWLAHDKTKINPTNDLGIKYHPTKLGYWDRELNDITHFKVLRAKSYIARYKKNDKLVNKVVVAGLGKETQQLFFSSEKDFKNFNPGSLIINGKQGAGVYRKSKGALGEVIVKRFDYTIKNKNNKFKKIGNYYKLKKCCNGCDFDKLLKYADYDIKKAEKILWNGDTKWLK